MSNKTGMAKAIKEASDNNFPIDKLLCLRDQKRSRRDAIVKGIMRQHNKEEREARKASKDA